MAASKSKRWFVAGTVQGVGFRYFARHQAQALGLSGWAKNLGDGRVEVFATGAPGSLNELAAALHKGPPMANVRTVEEQDAAAEDCSGFHVR